MSIFGVNWIRRESSPGVIRSLIPGSQGQAFRIPTVCIASLSNGTSILVSLAVMREEYRV